MTVDRVQVAVADRVDQRSTRPARSSTRRNVAVVAVLVSLQAGFFAAMFQFVADPLSSGDAAVLYRPTALNIAHHGTYSVMTEPPYLPTITKMPGYSLFVAALYAVTGDRPGVVQVAQFLLIGATALLAGSIARRMAGDRASLVAAGLVAAYPPLGQFAMRHLSEVLTVFLVTAMTLALLRLHDVDPERRRDAALAAALVGTTTGALILVRQSFVPLVPLTLAALLCRGTGTTRQRARTAGVVALTTTLIVGPWCVRNMAVSRQPLPFGANTGLSLLVSVRQYSGEYPVRYERETTDDYLATIADQLRTIDSDFGAPAGSAPGMAEGVGGGPAREARLDASLTDLAMEEARAVPIGRALATVPTRLRVLWSDPLGLPFTRHLDPVLMVVGLLGLVAVRSRRVAWPLWLPVAHVSATHMIFHVETRYSLAVRPLVLIGTAVLLTEVGRRLRPQPAEARVLGPATDVDEAA